MQKLKRKTKTKLFYYQYYLKKNNLKKYRFKLKQNLFQNPIFLNSTNLTNIELDKCFNHSLPSIHKKTNKIIYHIQKQYKTHSLLNYNLNYHLLYYFTKIFFKNKIKIKGSKRSDIHKIKIIKGRILNIHQSKVFISIFGLIFKIKFKDLIHKTIKKKLIKKIISYYKLKYLNFKIDKDINTLCRKTYVQEMIEKKKKNASI